MRTPLRASRLLPVTALVLALLPHLGTGVEEQRATRDWAQQGRAMELTWRLIAESERQHNNVTGLAEQVLPLSSEQRQRVRQLGIEQEEEGARLLRQLANTYAGKVREVLNDEQGKLYDGVLSCLEELAQAQGGAWAEFLKAGEIDPARVLHMPDRRTALADPTLLLDHNEDTRRQLQQIQHELYKSLASALQRRLDREQLTDPEAWEEHVEQFRQAQKDAQADFEARRKDLLTAGQIEKLQKVESAARQYQQRLQEARRTAYPKLYELLQPRGSGE